MEMIIIENRCPFCGKGYEFEAPLEGVFDWQAGVLVQEAFPTLSATKREHFVSGLCEDCQKKIFGEGVDI